MGCGHDPARDREVRSRELTTEQWFGIFDQLAEAGCLWMTWTGGEILLRSDFRELYSYAKRKGFHHRVTGVSSAGLQ